MRLRRFLARTLVAMTALQASVGQADDSATPLSFHDAKSGLSFTIRGDGRTLVITTTSGGYLGVFDPLFDADDGREGTVSAMRIATPAEIANFKPGAAGPYVLLSYSGGGVLVVSTARTAAIRPRRCNAVGVAVVSRNIACKYDLAIASDRQLDAMLARNLVDGPSTITPLVFSVPCSHITLHVEADGRTVWATGRSGVRLWTADPFERAGIKPYRYQRPIISKILPPGVPGALRCRSRQRPVVYLMYTSTQTGPLDVLTGRFTVTAQD
jgi:hypothetical protein